MRGTVVYLYAFDVASEIKTTLVREVLGHPASPLQINAGSTIPRDLPLYRPLTVGLQPLTAETSVGRLCLKPLVKIFEFGVVSISYEAAFTVSDPGALLPYHQLAVGTTPLGSLAAELEGHVSESLRPCMVKPSRDRREAEAYTVFCFTDLDTAKGSARQWADERRVALAGLLTEEPEPDRLSPSQVDESFRHTLAYSKDDLTVVDWDAAIVVDRAGRFDDVLYVIDLANLQLEQLRLLDERLDRFIVRAYDDLERYYASRRFWSEPRTTLATLRAIRMDIGKISEEATNVTKFVGDWYLARVYLACKDRFHLGRWDAGVDQKIRQLDELYSMVHAEIQSRRMMVMEAVIVALFLLDLAILLLKK